MHTTNTQLADGSLPVEACVNQINAGEVPPPRAIARVKKSRRFVLLRCLLPLLAACVCWGDTVAAYPVGGTANRSDPMPYMLGWEFSVSAPLNITALAYLDASGAGLGEPHMVGVCNATTGALLISATIPAGESTPTLNGFRIAPVSLVLQPGTYVIGGQRLTDADGAFLLSSSVATAPGVTYLQERELQTSDFTMPTTNATAAGIGVFGPSFVVASSASVPTITGINNSASYQPAFSPLTYTTIYGTNLSNTTRPWNPSDFAGGYQLPLSLDGVSATVDGIPAWVEYISPVQVNIISPSTAVTGKGVFVTVTTPGQVTVTTWVAMQPIAPSLFTYLTGTAETNIYANAQHANYTYVGKPNLFPDEPANFTTPAQPGETILLYGTGFGSTTPSIAPGIITDMIYNLVPLPTATIGGLPAQVTFAGLIPGFAEVYQVQVTIPTAIADGDWPIVLNVNGTTSFPALVTVQH